MRDRALGIGLIGFVIACVAVYVIGLDEAVLKVLGNLAQTLSGLLAAFFLFRAALAFSKEDTVRPYWLWLAVGYVLNALGFITFAVYETVLGLEVPTPSLADAFWWLSYPALFFGTVALLRQYLNSGLAVQRNNWTWAIVAVMVAASCYFLGVPILTSDASWGEKLSLLAYPIMDAFLFGASVAIALIIRQFGAGKLGAPWTFIGLGMITVTVADMVYTYLTLQETYATGNLVDLGWVLQGALVAWGGILQYRLVRGEGAATEAA